MTPEAIIMLLVSTGVLWGGLVAAIVNLRRAGQNED